MDNNTPTRESGNDVLKSFGGTAKHDLNAILNNFDDSSEEFETFMTSPYFDLESISEISQTQKRTFKVLSLNIQSIQAKFNHFLSFLQILSEKNISFDSILLQETWLSESWIEIPENMALYQIPGYILFPQGKKCCGHGGLFTYVRDIYKCSSPRTLYQHSDVYEALYIDVTCEDLDDKITLGNIYRPSKSTGDYKNVSTFIQQINPVIDFLDKEKSTLILGGDFNINLIEINQKEKFQEFFDMLVSRGLYPGITLPTRFSTHRATLLDNIFCKVPNSNMKSASGIFIGKLSDHLLVFTCLDVFQSKTQRPKFVTVQEKSTKAVNEFAKYMHFTINQTVFNRDILSDPNENYEKLEHIILEGNSLHFPKKDSAFQLIQT